MKNTACFCLTLLLFLTVPTVHAEAAASAGKIYSTDILAECNGAPIPSYNIGGKTAIVVEDLLEYGFDVWYDDNARGLYVLPNDGVITAWTENVTRGKAEKTLGNIFKTDIVTYINGEKIESFNIGGRTCVCIEDLGDLMGSPNAAYGYSKYYMNCVWNAADRVISLNALTHNLPAANPLAEFG